MKMTFIQAIAQQEHSCIIIPKPIPRHNPGNIEEGKFAQSHLALPSDGNRFAAWENDEDGYNAMRILLRANYIGKTVSAAINIWSSPLEDDNAIYIKNVCVWTG